MAGKMPPDFSEIQIGESMKIVNGTIGKPEQIAAMTNGRKLYIYKYEKGRDRSFKETLANGVLSISSLALWEFVPTHNKHMGNLYLTYNDAMEVDSINRYIP